jgi:hypothetical protein
MSLIEQHDIYHTNAIANVEEVELPPDVVAFYEQGMALIAKVLDESAAAGPKESARALGMVAGAARQILGHAMAIDAIAASGSDRAAAHLIALDGHGATITIMLEETQKAIERFFDSKAKGG